MADATVNFGDGSPSGDATFGTALPHTYAAAKGYSISAMTADGKRGYTSATGPGTFDITVAITGAPATGATAGTPGTFTPVGCATPANAAAIAALTASPTTAWTTGQYVAAANADQSHWDAAAWVAGVAP